MLDTAQRKRIVAIAREAVEAAIRGEPAPRVEAEDEALQRPCGAFVTLKSGGRLRGCIGQFTSDRPLRETIQQMARAAATEDPRFVADRIRPEEVPHLEIEVSVLSPLERTDDPLSLEPGKHGVYIKKGFRSGCFLPQVATETGWSKEEFLRQCCAGKAGLPPDAWRDPSTEVYLFTAEVIHEGA